MSFQAYLDKIKAKIGKSRRSAMSIVALLTACSGDAPPSASAGGGGGREAAPTTFPGADSTARRLWLTPSSGRIADIDAGTTRADLVRRFGEANLRAGDISIGEGVTMAGTVLFPDDSVRRIEIVWVDVKSRARPARLQLSGNRSLWTVAPGISLGSSLREIEGFNGGPVTLTGFGWDFGGVITGLRGGRLQHLKGGQPNVFLRLNPSVGTDAEYEKLRLSVQGDREFGSEIAAMQRLNPRLHEIVISYEPR